MGMNPGRMRYTATFYRRSGATSTDSRGRASQAWAVIATGVAVAFEIGSGRVVPAPAGQNVEISGKALVRRREFAAGSEPQQGDAVVFTDGRTPASTYLVHRAGPWKEDYHYEALSLQDTEESVP